MSPRARLLPPLVGVLLLSAACGSPPEALPSGPTLPQASAGLPPSGMAGPPPVWSPPVVPTGPLYPTVAPTTTYVVPTRTTTTTPPATSPTPTPSHAPPCTGEPTGEQIVTLIREHPAVPDGTLAVSAGPLCSGDWSFTTVGKAGAEPLSVVTSGTGTELTVVTLGTDVCNPQVKAQAPVGIRVLACGY
ncbi:hypothetical protein [Actinoplanes sp. G11-F43]|uniref:hypothetical protein n=1 Tax=Actinoplanes sp. G11-F43 TaxID=3424130 RepID=UPI003D3259EF